MIIYSLKPSMVQCDSYQAYLLYFGGGIFFGFLFSSCHPCTWPCEGIHSGSMEMLRQNWDVGGVRKSQSLPLQARDLIKTDNRWR